MIHVSNSPDKMSDPQSVLGERTQDGGKGRHLKKCSLINHSINSRRKVRIQGFSLHDFKTEFARSLFNMLRGEVLSFIYIISVYHYVYFVIKH